LFDSSLAHCPSFSKFITSPAIISNSSLNISLIESLSSIQRVYISDFLYEKADVCLYVKPH
jgi:hypothetical protein